MTITAGLDIDLLTDFHPCSVAVREFNPVSRQKHRWPFGKRAAGFDLHAGKVGCSPGAARQRGLRTSIKGSSITLAGYTGWDATGLLHAGDPNPAVVSAGGNISDLMLYMSKKTDVIAGGNISDLYYSGHNDASDDVTIIRAVGNILFSSQVNAVRSNTGIWMSGPGALVVEAGLSMDLGTSAGIQALGNTLDTLYPSQLPATGCTLIVASGYSKDFSDTAADVQFFSTLQTDGTEYSKDLAAGDTAEAAQIVAKARADTIVPFFAGSASKGSGNIEMTASQISSLSPSRRYFHVRERPDGRGQEHIFRKRKPDITDRHLHSPGRTHKHLCQRRRQRERVADHDLPGR